MLFQIQSTVYQFNGTVTQETYNNKTDLESELYDIVDYLPRILVYATISICAICGNVLILLCVCASKNSNSSIHIHIGNLAVSDLVVGLIVLPYFIVVDCLNINSDKYFCLAKASLMVFAVGGSTWAPLMISVDRFSAVCFPLSHIKNFNTRRTIILIALGWVYVAIWSFFPLSRWNLYDYDVPVNCRPDKVLTPNFQKVVNIHFSLALAITFALYITVVKIAMNKAKQIHDETFVYTRRRNLRELYKAKTMAIVQGLFVICWLPFVTVSIVLCFEFSVAIEDVQEWSFVLGVLNSALKWSIYGARKKQLRAQMKKYVKCFRRPSNGDITLRVFSTS